MTEKYDSIDKIGKVYYGNSVIGSISFLQCLSLHNNSVIYGKISGSLIEDIHYNNSNPKKSKIIKMPLHSINSDVDKLFKELTITMVLNKTLNVPVQPMVSTKMFYISDIKPTHIIDGVYEQSIENTQKILKFKENINATIQLIY
jgi:hypothetical protein